MAKIAVVFPGIGYHTDRPLLYHAKRVAMVHGYECRDVPYKNFPSGVRGDASKMTACYEIALEQTEEILKDVDFSQYSDILFLSKSIGTAVAAAYASRHGLNTRNVYFTPVAQTFSLRLAPGIAFHGTHDSWADTQKIVERCRERSLPLTVVEGADHSLETGDWRRDLEILMETMDAVDRYLNES